MRLTTHLGQHGDVVIEVRDSGKGIPRDFRPASFEPFFTTKPVGVGTGLGLSIAHRSDSVTAMGGSLSVESEPGRGSVFRVRLPAAEPSLTRSSASLVAAPAVDGGRRAKILVIDDEERIGTMLARVLGADHDVEATTDANGVIARVRAGERVICSSAIR